MYCTHLLFLFLMHCCCDPPAPCDHRAEDTFRPGRSVAIKVINIGCGAVAVREVRFMRFLGSVPNADFCPGTRMYVRSFCLMVQTTLM